MLGLGDGRGSRARGTGTAPAVAVEGDEEAEKKKAKGTGSAFSRLYTSVGGRLSLDRDRGSEKSVERGRFSMDRGREREKSSKREKAVDREKSATLGTSATSVSAIASGQSVATYKTTKSSHSVSSFNSLSSLNSSSSVENPPSRTSISFTRAHRQVTLRLPDQPSPLQPLQPQRLHQSLHQQKTPSNPPARAPMPSILQNPAALSSANTYPRGIHDSDDRLADNALPQVTLPHVPATYPRVLPDVPEITVTPAAETDPESTPTASPKADFFQFRSLPRSNTTTKPSSPPKTSDAPIRTCPPSLPPASSASLGSRLTSSLPEQGPSRRPTGGLDPRPAFNPPEPRSFSSWAANASSPSHSPDSGWPRHPWTSTPRSQSLRVYPSHHHLPSPEPELIDLISLQKRSFGRGGPHGGASAVLVSVPQTGSSPLPLPPPPSTSDVAKPIVLPENTSTVSPPVVRAATWTPSTTSVTRKPVAASPNPPVPSIATDDQGDAETWVVDASVPSLLAEQSLPESSPSSASSTSLLPAAVPVTDPKNSATTAAPATDPTTPATATIPLSQITSPAALLSLLAHTSIFLPDSRDPILDRLAEIAVQAKLKAAEATAAAQQQTTQGAPSPSSPQLRPTSASTRSVSTTPPPTPPYSSASPISPTSAAAQYRAIMRVLWNARRMSKFRRSEWDSLMAKIEEAGPEGVKDEDDDESDSTDSETTAPVDGKGEGETDGEREGTGRARSSSGTLGAGSSLVPVPGTGQKQQQVASSPPRSSRSWTRSRSWSRTRGVDASAGDNGTDASEERTGVSGGGVAAAAWAGVKRMGSGGYLAGIMGKKKDRSVNDV
ncbi:hypothetical protein HDU93_009979 [Gonapodya sp. JEL0774]|nr:hypothetical protein HDU93_009979 [Gonapodya sp. JEL0774]